MTVDLLLGPSKARFIYLLTCRRRNQNRESCWALVVVVVVMVFCCSAGHDGGAVQAEILPEP